MNNEILAQALVKIQISDDTYQTGFLCTDYGHILTTGHGLKNEKVLVGAFLNGTFENGKNAIVYKLQVLEYLSSKQDYIDYGVLKIVSQEFYSEVRYKLDLIRFDSKLKRNSELVIAGYVFSMEEDVANLFSAKLIGTHPIGYKKERYWLQLKVDTMQNLEGSSGAPVLYNGKVIGIQNLQTLSDKGDCYATSIDCIPSYIIKNELRDGNKLFFLKPYLFSSEKSLSSYNPSHPKSRNALFISDLYDNEENQIINSVRDQTQQNEFHTHLNDILKKISPLAGTTIPTYELKLIACSKDDVTSLENITEEYDNYFDHFSDFLRCIIDTGDNLKEKMTHSFHEGKNNRSHIIGIELRKSELNELVVSSVTGYNIFFYINYSDIDFAKSYIQKILFGIILDISYFSSISGLQGLTSSVQAQRSFSLRKVEFGRKNGLQMFNSIKIPSGISYISFSWLIRQKSQKYFDFDYLNYNFLWKKFLTGNEGLFNQVNGLNAPLAELTIEELLNDISKIKYLSGQLPINKLKKKFEEMGSLHNGKLCALVILVKRPKSIIDKNRIRASFSGEIKLKNVAIIPISNLEPVMSFSHLVNFYYFIKKG